MGEAISGAVSGMNTGPVLLLIGITLVFLLLGMFLEPNGAMLNTLPIFLPLVGAAGKGGRPSLGVCRRQARKRISA
jgi:TRAP-type C4-dicarboxylate transport system permease large subunit